jgi:hypothetical protein
MFAFGGIAAAVILAATAVPGSTASQQRTFGIYKQVAGERFAVPRPYYRRYYRPRHWTPGYYVSNYHPYFYYAPLHYYAPPPGIRYYGPGVWAW